MEQNAASQGWRFSFAPCLDAIGERRHGAEPDQTKGADREKRDNYEDEAECYSHWRNPK
jgi:hypothetical protein